MGAIIGIAVFGAALAGAVYAVGLLALAILSPFGHSKILVRMLAGCLYIALALFAGAWWFGSSPVSTYEAKMSETRLSSSGDGYGTVVIINTGDQTLRRVVFEAEVRDCSDPGAQNACALAATESWGIHVRVPPGQRRQYETSVDFDDLPDGADSFSLVVTGARSFW